MIRYYERHSECREKETLVSSCEKEGDKIFLRLEETIFFPEEGGQHADTGRLLLTGPDGSIKEIRVLDGQQKKGDIRYLVDQEIPAGTKVLQMLDWEQRWSRMQQHTGEHILTGVIHNKYGCDNVGFHLSDDAPVTLDLNEKMTYEEALLMETEANRMVWANLPVLDLYPTAEKLCTLSYRSKIEIEGQVRLISIGRDKEKIDLCACCAPHVKHTGEVGLIKIVSFQNYKGGVRIGILCGERALNYLRQNYDAYQNLARSLSTGTDQVAEKVSAMQEEISRLKAELASYREKELLGRIREIKEDEPAILFLDEVLAPGLLKAVFNALTEKNPGFAGIFMGSDPEGYRYAAGSNRKDSRELAAAMREALGAKGGGSREMIQGKTAAGRSQIEDFWKSLS